MDIGRYELDYGFAPIDAVNKAIAYFEKAVKINPQGNELYLGLVSVTGILTKYDYIMGKDCRQRAAEAAAYFKRGLEVNPNDTSLYIRMAENYIILAHCQLARRQSPLAALRQADELLRKAKTLNPKYYEIYTREGESFLLKARWQSISGQDSPAYFRAAQISLAQAAALNPKDIYTLLTMARLGWWKAELEALRGQRTAAAVDLDNGLSALQKALTINPNYAETHALKGILLQLQADNESDETKRLAAQVEARVALLKGMNLNKNLQDLYAPYLQKKK
jgi:tetratricopeptide (TPR) repeat protein